MGMFGIGGKKVAKKKVDSTGYTAGQKKAQEAGKSVKAISAIARRRKAMADILGK